MRYTTGFETARKIYTQLRKERPSLKKDILGFEPLFRDEIVVHFKGGTKGIYNRRTHTLRFNDSMLLNGD